MLVVIVGQEFKKERPTRFSPELFLCYYILRNHALFVCPLLHLILFHSYFYVDRCLVHIYVYAPHACSCTHRSQKVSDPLGLQL